MLQVPLKLSHFNEVLAAAHGSRKDICGRARPVGAYLQLCMKWQKCAMRPRSVKGTRGGSLQRIPFSCSSVSSQNLT